MSWDQLKAIAQENYQIYINEQTQRPTACPNDGQPLQEDKDGILRCSFDGWSER